MDLDGVQGTNVRPRNDQLPSFHDDGCNRRVCKVLDVGVWVMIASERFTAWIVFQGADHRRFWRIFTGRGWRHCFIVVPAYNPTAGLRAGRASVVIDPRSNHVSIDVLFMPPKEVADHLLGQGAKCVIKFNVDRRGLPDYVPRGILTCVSMLKAICGIGAWYVWTPKHFARWLLRNGGELVVKDLNDETVWNEKTETGPSNAEGATSPVEGD